MEEVITPLFDSSLKAVSFALNHSTESYTVPLMTQAANALSGGRSAGLYQPGRVNLSGLSGAGQAGLILRQLEALPRLEQLAVVARAAKPAFPCSCGSACCVGLRPNKQWALTVQELADIVGEFLRFAQTATSAAKGKKRIHTPPQLRLKFVQKHFGIKHQLADLGEQFNLTESTVISHRKPIQAFLTQVERDGWEKMDNTLTHLNLVGAV